MVYCIEYIGIWYIVYGTWYLVYSPGCFLGRLMRDLCLENSLEAQCSSWAPIPTSKTQKPSGPELQHLAQAHAYLSASRTVLFWCVVGYWPSGPQKVPRMIRLCQTKTFDTSCLLRWFCSNRGCLDLSCEYRGPCKSSCVSWRISSSVELPNLAFSTHTSNLRELRSQGCSN